MHILYIYFIYMFFKSSYTHVSISINEDDSVNFVLI